MRAGAVMLVLVGLASFMMWHVIYWCAGIMGMPSPAGWAWWLCVPIGVKLVLR